MQRVLLKIDPHSAVQAINLVAANQRRAADQKLPPVPLPKPSGAAQPGEGGNQTGNSENNSSGRGTLDLIERRRMVDAAENQVAASIIAVLLLFLTLTATAWAACAAGVAAKAARDSVKIAAETAQRQLRAYLGLTNAGIEGVSIGCVPVASFSVMNTGQTPAYDVRLSGDITIGPHPLPEGVGLPAPGVDGTDPSAATQQPGQTMGMLGASQRMYRREDFGREIPEEIVTALGDGTKVIYVYGEITYRDAFDDRWTMRYRYICRGLTDTKGLYIESIEETKDPSQERPHSEAPSSWFRRLKSLTPT